MRRPLLLALLPAVHALLTVSPMGRVSSARSARGRDRVERAAPTSRIFSRCASTITPVFTRTHSYSRGHTRIHEDGWEIALGARREVTISLPDGQVMRTGPPRRGAAWSGACIGQPVRRPAPAPGAPVAPSGRSTRLQRARSGPLLRLDGIAAHDAGGAAGGGESVGRVGHSVAVTVSPSQCRGQARDSCRIPETGVNLELL